MGKMASGARWGLILTKGRVATSFQATAKWPVEPVGD